VKVEYGIQATSGDSFAAADAGGVSAVTTSTTNRMALPKYRREPAGHAGLTRKRQAVDQDIQTDLATAQATMKDATARQKQAQGMLQSIVDQTETVSPIRWQLSSWRFRPRCRHLPTTSMLSQMSLVSISPPGRAR